MADGRNQVSYYWHRGYKETRGRGQTGPCGNELESETLV